MHDPNPAPWAPTPLAPPRSKDKPAELVAKFIDARLRAGGNKGLSEGELEEALDAALGLFRLINVRGAAARRAAGGRAGAGDGNPETCTRLRGGCARGALLAALMLGLAPPSLTALPPTCRPLWRRPTPAGQGHV